MKTVVNIARFLVGTLFIFSGLVKAIDPLGLAYKMQEFFEAWSNAGIMKGLMSWLDGQALMFSVIMITLEVILGVALLLGWKKNIVSWLLLLLMLFFTFLTSYVLFSGKIRACGCFGDCIPLTPIQTFTKDIVLLVLVLVILFGRKYINPLFSNTVSAGLFFISLFAVLGLQWYVLKHLPVKDCLPFKIGNNILELRKVPKDATYDKFQYTYFYKKNGEEKAFEYGKQPDSTWIYQEEKLPNKKLIEKGNGKVALINDFILNTASGNDTTDAVLNQSGEYYLLYVQKLPNTKHTEWINRFYEVYKKGIPCFYVTSNPVALNAHLSTYQPNKMTILTCDYTAIKTAARNDVTLYLMKGPVVKNKWGGENDVEKALK